jgi:glutamine synthetase
MVFAAPIALNALYASLPSYKPYHAILGAELEFYMVPANAALLQLIDVREWLNERGDLLLNLVAESGKGQYELQAGPTTDIDLLAHTLTDARPGLQGVLSRLNRKLDFTAKPNPDQPGSSLHIHFSLYREDGRNAFAKRPDGAESPLLLSAIAGILHHLPAAMPMLCPTADCYARFQVPDLYTPSTYSWGYNNRSAAIRIPTSSAIDRRIELRVASSMANPAEVIAFLLQSAHDGITTAMQPPPATYGVTSHPNYDLIPMPRSLEEAMEAVHTA